MRLTNRHPASVTLERMVTSGQETGELEQTAAIARDLIRFETVNWGGGRSKGETEAA